MSKFFLSVLLLLFLFTSCTAPQKITGHVQPHDLEQLIAQLHRPQNGKVMVAAHRCDWRNHPENSMPALLSAIAMGADIAEIDLKKTKDGHFILLHDRTLDRNTNGKGNPENYTLEEIKKLRLKNGLGRVTNVQIPSFTEFLKVAKGKILINIDKGYDYFPEVIALLKETGTLQQAIINIDDNTTLDEVEARYGKVPDDVFLMPVVVYNGHPRSKEVVKSYLRHKKTIFQPVWKDDMLIKEENFLELKRQGYGIWMNSLWASLNGGHDDDSAVEQNRPDETWGWLIQKGASIIQTDRPEKLLKYISR
ncbi:MAG TPA: glycerophosphodiester phosphodiesterase family protein [Niabella sp.]|nr:glycerophosphodiester phosphodiesterase family protein [Niabella sp.]